MVKMDILVITKNIIGLTPPICSIKSLAKYHNLR